MQIFFDCKKKLQTSCLSQLEAWFQCYGINVRYANGK